MILVYLWIPFIALGMLVGSCVHAPFGREYVEGHGFRTDRFWVVGLICGLIGPLFLVLWAITRTQNLLGDWLRIESPMPPHLRALGVATPADVDRLSKEVRAGERPCFIPAHACGICGVQVMHVRDLPPISTSCPDPQEHVVCAGLKTTLDAMSQEERDAIVRAMQTAAERQGTDRELAVALERAKS